MAKYNFGGGLGASAKSGWQKKRGMKEGWILPLPKRPTQEYVNDLSCISRIAVAGLNKAGMSWKVPTKVKLKLTAVGKKDDRVLFKAVAVGK